jgi:signal peptidase II
MKTRIKILLFCITAFAFIGCDRVTKDLAKKHLMDKPAISYFHDTFRLLYVENTGAALGLGDSLPKTANIILLSILPLAFLTGLFIYTIKKSKKVSLITMLAVSMVFAGGVGNIIDRLLYDRHVPDFLNIGINDFRTGIFNIADVCVTTGFIVLILFYRKKPIIPQSDAA